VTFCADKIIPWIALKLLSTEAFCSARNAKLSFGGRAPPGPTGELIRSPRPPDSLAVAERKDADNGKEGKKEAVVKLYTLCLKKRGNEVLQ